MAEQPESRIFPSASVGLQCGQMLGTYNSQTNEPVNQVYAGDQQLYEAMRYPQKRLRTNHYGHSSLLAPSSHAICEEQDALLKIQRNMGYQAYQSRTPEYGLLSPDN